MLPFRASGEQLTLMTILGKTSFCARIFELAQNQIDVDYRYRQRFANRVD